MVLGRLFSGYGADRKCERQQLCAGSTGVQAPDPGLAVEGLDLRDGVYIFVLAQFAASYEGVRRVRVSVLEFVLQAHNPW